MGIDDLPEVWTHTAYNPYPSLPYSGWGGTVNDSRTAQKACHKFSPDVVGGKPMSAAVTPEAAGGRPKQSAVSAPPTAGGKPKSTGTTVALLHKKTENGLETNNRGPCSDYVRQGERRD